VTNEDDKDVCTFVMTDHVCRDMAVREEISRHETSAADARATQPVTRHVREHKIDSLPSPLNPNVHISSREPRVCDLDVSGSNASLDSVRD
jgi:hypothetical protein